MKQGHLFIVSGPSGVGKTVVFNAVKERLSGFVRIITCTTRAPRPHEKDGVDYHFLTEDQFKKRIKEKAFLEWAVVHDMYYGTPKPEAMEAIKQGKNVLIILDVQGALKVKKDLKDSHLIFLLPQSMESLVAHLKKRADMPPEEFDLRLKNAKKEIKMSSKYDFRITNREGKIEETIQEAIAVIKGVIHDGD